MDRREICEEIAQENTLFADGFDEALLGLDQKGRAVYSVSKCIDILSENMELQEAVEYFYFNTAGAYVGEMTPIWVEDDGLTN
jgi:hypothetical protein